MRKIKNFITVLFLLFTNLSFCQQTADTAALIREFKKVLNFTTQPYLYYTGTLKMEATPLLNTSDSMQSPITFYKNETNLYYSNGTEEVYLQDSLLIQVNHERKSIWINRVDMNSKENLNALPVGNKQLQSLLRRKYIIQKERIDEHDARLDFQTRQLAGRSYVINTNVKIDFIEKSHFPKNMEMEIQVQQPVDASMVEQINSQGTDASKLMKQIDGHQCLVRTEKMKMNFKLIDTNKKTVAQMPTWQTILQYIPEEKTYKGKGEYAAYDISKMF